MRIALDVRPMTPHFPGIQRYIKGLLSGFNTLDLGAEAIRLTALRTATQPDPGIPDHPVEAGSFTLAQQWQVPRALRHLDVDVYHSTYYVMPYHPGRPTVLTWYDLIPLLFPRHVSFSARWLFPILARLALRTATRVIAISQATKDDLIRRLGISPDRIDVVPLAADPAFCPAPSTAITTVRERLALPRDYVLYVGSNKPHKNLVTLVRAWARLYEEDQHGGCQLVIAGPWDPRYPEARDEAASLLERAAIRFLGPVPEPDLPALYSGATAFVFPSLYEGFGLPVLEAMSCGTPVVCADRSSLREVAADAAILVDPTDVATIARGIATVLHDGELRVRLREAGLRRAREFNWQETARQTIETYRQAAQMHGN
ncbi:MAG: glycosyltransferase family 1 protein [Anaerolineae bacterium]